MSTKTTHWLIPQLERLNRSRPQTIEKLLDCALQVNPELRKDLALMAAYYGDISIEECASYLGRPREEVRNGLDSFADEVEEMTENDAIVHDIKGVARLREARVPVWEIVRAFRKVDSVAELQLVFPKLSESEIRAALSYTGRNPDEIAAQISAYEEIASRAKAAYPFS